MTVAADPRMLLLGFLCPLCAQYPERCGHRLPDTDWADVSVHRIDLPYPQFPKYPALSPNLRGNRWDQHADVQNVRHTVATLARQAEVRPRRACHRPPRVGATTSLRAGRRQPSVAL